MKNCMAENELNKASKTGFLFRKVKFFSLNLNGQYFFIKRTLLDRFTRSKLD